MSSRFERPYSWTATRLSGRPAIASSNSRHVFGSGTVTVIGTFHSRSTALGFGPRATTVSPRKACGNRSSPSLDASTWARYRVPTPVSRIIMSNCPAYSWSANANAFVFSSKGTSTSAGATNGTPPLIRISSEISAARRLSNASTRASRKDICSRIVAQFTLLQTARIQMISHLREVSCMSKRLLVSIILTAAFPLLTPAQTSDASTPRKPEVFLDNHRPLNPKKQKDPTTRNVSGRVTDSFGQPLEGALVILTDGKTNEKRTFITKKDG